MNLLHLIDMQKIMFALLKVLEKQLTFLICDVNLRLLVNKISI